MLPKCYESLIITALLTVFLGVMCLMPAPCSGYPPPPRQHHRPSAVSGGGGDYYCAATREKFYMRHRCGQGYVSVSRKNRVVVQETGLDENHPAVAIWKETCTSAANNDKNDPESGSEATWKRRPRSSEQQQQPLAAPHHYVRYRHETSDRYICFDRRGRIKAVSEKKVKKKGLLCMFEEHQVDTSFHTIRSLYNPAWHVAFNTRRTFRLGRHKAVPSRRGQGANRNSCEAQFHSSALSHHLGGDEAHQVGEGGGSSSFLGIFQQISGSDRVQGTDAGNLSAGRNAENLDNDGTRAAGSSSDNKYNNTVNLAVEQRLQHEEQPTGGAPSSSGRRGGLPARQLASGFRVDPQRVARIQHAWAVTTRPLPKMRHIANKRPRPARRERNLRKRRRRRMKAMRAQRALSRKPTSSVKKTGGD